MVWAMGSFLSEPETIFNYRLPQRAFACYVHTKVITHQALADRLEDPSSHCPLYRYVAGENSWSSVAPVLFFVKFSSPMFFLRCRGARILLSQGQQAEMTTSHWSRNELEEIWI